MKLIIAGSRTFNKLHRLVFVLDKLLAKTDIKDVQIISGMAKGADLLGKYYAETKGIEVICMPAEWDKYGKSAGYKRNEEMAKIATHCVCFWDGESRGTKHMIDLAEKYDLELRIIKK